jgi:hypothetical protein
MAPFWLKGSSLQNRRIINKGVFCGNTSLQLSTILIDGRVIAAYSRGQIVLPKSNMLDETRRSRGDLSYSIKGELFGQDYRQQLPYHLIFCSHVLLSWIIPNEIRHQWRRGGISVAPPDQKVFFFFLISKFEITFWFSN